MTVTSCIPKRSSRRRISRRRFLRYTGLAGLALLSGGAAGPLFGGPSNHADADQSYKVYFPLIAKVPPIPPLSQELVQEAYEFYSPILGERDSLPSPEQLVYEIKPNLNHPDQPPIVFACDPETGHIILATRVNWQTYEQEWHVAGLRDLADALGIIVGSQFSSIYYPYAELENVNQLSLQEFLMGRFLNIPLGTRVNRRQP